MLRRDHAARIDQQSPVALQSAAVQTGFRPDVQIPGGQRGKLPAVGTDGDRPVRHPEVKDHGGGGGGGEQQQQG